MRKKKILTEEMLINWWLTKYHNTTLEEVFKEHPDWDSRKFYSTYPVTQEQHDEWHTWMLEELRKHYKLSKEYIRTHSGFIYLNTSPSVKDKKE